MLPLIAAASAWLGLSTAAAGDTGDVVAASRRLRERTSTLSAAQPVTPGLTRDVGAIAVVEHDGTDYSRLEPDGTPNYAARARVARTFYESHGDQYDFLLVFTNFPFDTAGAVAFHGLVRNDVTGIGMPVVNNGPLFGSPGRLKGYVDMAFVDQYRHAPFSSQPGQPGFDEAVGVIAHEIGHQWLARVRYRNSAGVDAQDLLGLDQSHWSYLLDSDASLMYGSDWTSAGSGVYRAARVRLGYSALDLYLMGLLESARVPPFTLLRNPAVNPAQLPVEGATVSATPEAIAITQVVAAESARVPDHLASQKDFRMGVVFLAAPGVEPSPEDLKLADRMRSAFESKFFAMTRGVAFVDTTLAEEPAPEPLPAPDVEGALAWLRARQGLDGRWEDAAGTAVRDTSSALETLRAVDAAGLGYARGQAWLTAAPIDNLDFAARRAQARAVVAAADERAALTAALFAHQNPDGGFGVARGFESDGLDTALALSALRELRAPADARVRSAFGALAALHQPGGWSLVPGRAPSTVATALALSALQAWADEPEAAVLLPVALAALLSRQNEDGGFGESPSTAHGTALALLALDRSGAPGDVIDDAIAWLQRTQGLDRSWNGRAYETALAIRALKGRTAPNLLVRQDDLTLNPTHADEGDVVTVTARVRNDGRLASPQTLLRLYDGSPAPAHAVAEAPVPALEPAANAVVTLSFDTQGRPGTRLLTVVADPNRAISEVREDDNAASRSLVVDGPQPDLQVLASDIVVAPYPPETGEAVTITVTVRNRGDREAAPSALRVTRTVGAASIAVGAATIPALPAGGAAAVGIPWTVPAVAGTSTMTAIADALFTLPESDETNNAGSVTVEVTPPGGSGPDFEVPLVTSDPGAISTIPQSFDVRAVVRNLGRDPLTSTVAFYDGTPETGTLLVEQPVTLGGRSSTVIAVPFEVVSPGDRAITAVVDRAGVVTESDETNNRASAAIDDPGNTFDAAVTTAVASQAEIVIGETVTVTATVANRGTRAFSGLPVVLGHDGVTFGELDRVSVTLEPGQSTTVTLSWTSTFTGTPVPLVVVADALDALAEIDEANNRRPVPVDVRPSALANLRLSGADLTFTPDPPLQGGSATITAVVHNASPVGVGSFVVRFFLGSPSAGGIVIGETTVPALTGGSTAAASIEWSPVTVYGHQGLWAVADALGQVEEYDETDNVGFRPFQAVSLPDLAISSAEFVIEPPFPHVHEETTIRVTVRNVGDRPAVESTLRVFDGEPASGTLLGERPVPALSAGQSVVMTLAWTAAVEGEHEFSVLADADEVQPEANEGNNLSRRAVVVQDADTYVTAAYFSPDGDGAFDETTIVYRAGETPSATVQISDARGQLVRTLATDAPAQGQVVWDGRGEDDRMLWDGTYMVTVRAASGAVTGRVRVVIDTNRGDIHSAAGTGMVAVRTFNPLTQDVSGVAWMPSEDEFLTIVTVDDPVAQLDRGLLRWRLDGTRSYVVRDEWFQGAGFASPDAVAPDGREVLLVKSGELVAVDLSTGLRRVITSTGVYYGVQWSPDGRRVVVGNAVYPRPGGSAEATLPGTHWRWSPDGERLHSGLNIVRRDGSDFRELESPVPIPSVPALGDRCLYGTHWRGDGRIVAHVGRWTLVGNEGGPHEDCVEERVFSIDPDGGESVELTALRGRPYSEDWSSDGSRLLFRDASVVGGWETDVAPETDGVPVRLWTAKTYASPRRLVAYGCTGSFGADCNGSLGTMTVVSSLLNLTADMAAVPLPGDSGILLKGTASDANFDRYELDYAPSSVVPLVWTPIGPASDQPTVDGLLGSWVPAQPGTYLVRLRVWDRAGTVREVVRGIAWNRTPPIGNITQSGFIFSPTGDGVKDEVRFDYLVQQPVRLDVRIEGPEPPPGSTTPPLTIRRHSYDLDQIGPGSFTWDGRDQTGALAADGRYRVYLNEIPFRVDLDATPPEIGWSHEAVVSLGKDVAKSPDELRSPDGHCTYGLVSVDDLKIAGRWHVVDPNLERWRVGEYSEDRQIFVPVEGEYQPDGTPVVKREDGQPVDVASVFPRTMYATLTARDRAGNVSTLEPVPLDEVLVATGVRPKPDCSLSQALQLPATQSVEPASTSLEAVNRLPLQPRFFFESGPFPHGAGPARFEFQNAAGNWIAGATNVHYVDVDLPALGLTPGPTYLGRIASEEGRTSEEFRFSLCRESMRLRIEVLPGGEFLAQLDVTVAVPLIGLRLEMYDKTTGIRTTLPFERTGPSSYRIVAPIPQSNCDETPPPGTPPGPPIEMRVLGERQDGRPLVDASQAACFDLFKGLFGCANQLAIWEEATECATAVPDRATVNVFARTLSPNALVTIETPSGAVAGTPYLAGERHCLPDEGPAEAYCDERQLDVDLSGFPAGPLTLRGAITDPAPLAETERDIPVDRTAPLVTMHQPTEGEGVCVDDDGGVERVMLTFEVEDEAPHAELLEASFRYGDGPWRPLCLGYSAPSASGQPVWRSDCAPPTYLLDTGRIHSRQWTVSGLPDGEYTLRFELCDREGNRSTFERRVTLFRGETAISIAGVDSPVFSPNGDGRSDLVTATVRLPQPLRMTVEVRAGSAGGALVRTLVADETFPAGDRAFAWDGHDAQGAVLPEGAFWIVATATNACGGVDTRSTKIELDVTPPAVAVTSPPPGSSVNTTVDVLGRATDDHFARYEVAFGAGPAPVEWTLVHSGSAPVGNASQVGLLGAFVPPAAPGPYTLRLLARDRAQNEAETRVAIEVTERALLDRLSVEPRAFSPNGDGRRDSTTIEYALLAPGRVTLEVRDGGDTVVRRFESGVDRPAGTFAVVWNGTTDGGTPVAEGGLRVHVRVEDPANAAVAQEASAGLLLDRTAPTVSLTSPLAGADVTNASVVHGTIEDVDLEQYVLEGLRPFAAPILLGQGTQSATDADLATLSAIPDGSLEIRVRAEDSAANRTEATVPVTVDSTAPQALIESPLAGAVLDRSATPLAVSGRATDVRLERWELAFGAGATPAYFVTIASGSEGGTGLALGQWSVASLPDGPYTLLLTARDRAGNRSESRAAVVLDSVAPTAVVSVPAEGAFLNASGPLDGTASDANLEGWTVEAAPGDAATAFQWSPLAEGTSSVTNGSLGEWASLPPDGVHTLRLTVRDGAGHVARTLRTVTIDTTPPLPPAGLSAVVRAAETGADVALTWTASQATDVSGYRVSIANGAVLAAVVPGLAYTEPAVPEGTRTYEVRAIDRAGNASVPASVTVRIDLTPPAADILFPGVGGRVNGAVEVRGTAFSPDDFAEYRLSVGVGETPAQWTLVRRSTVPVTAGPLGTWLATTPGPHVLALEAVDIAGNVARATVAVTVDPIPPPAPNLVSLTTPETAPPDTLVATWDLLTEPDVAGYLVYRDGQLANAPGIVLGDLRPYLVTGPQYVDVALPDGTHRYRIVAMDEAGNLSPPSNERSATLDNRRPHAALVTPPAGTRFEFPIQLVATTPDTDVLSVQFLVAPVGGPWSPIGGPDTGRPFERTLDPVLLAPGEYLLRAVASDTVGEDENPSDVPVVYGDATAPQPPANLTGIVDGEAVSLAWSAGPEPDLAGHHVYRDGVRLTGEPQPATTFEETRTEGVYAYAVTAVDADGNESSPAQVEVELYRLTLADLVPPQRDGPTAVLTGRGARGTGSIEIVRDGSVVAQTAAQSGGFTVAGVPLSSGPNLFTARERDGAGRASLASQAVVVVGNDPPAPVTGLTAQVDDHQVTLSWDAQTAPVLYGYDLRRDDAHLTAPVAQGSTINIYSSSESTEHPSSQAFDGNQQSSWLPAASDSAPFWAAEFQEPQRLLHGLVLHFANAAGPVPAPSHRVQADWNGHRVTLVESAGGPSAVASHVLTLPFATTRVRVEIEDAPFVGLAEVEVLALPLLPTDTPVFAEAVPDGRHSYQVAVVDRFGSRSGPATVEVAVGDVEAPPAPLGLSATVAGSDVTLDWQPVSVPDLADYVVHRDGTPIATGTASTHVDLGLPNGTYVYTVRARDAVGNESGDSAPATAVVQITLPVAPVLAASAGPDGSVSLAWNHPGAPRFEVLRSITTGGPYAAIAQTGTVLSYVDAAVRPGERVFYVVRAVDAAGNLSSPSNEATVLPVMPRPILLRPTDAAHPITLAATQAAFVGRAPRDALLALTVDGMLRGVATAGRAYEPMTLAQLPANAYLEALSPAARFVVFGAEDPSTGLPTRRLLDLATGSSVTLPADASAQGFSADERRLADIVSTCVDSACTPSVRVLDLDGGAITMVDSGGRMPYEAAWSPVGQELAILTASPDGADTRLQVVDPENGLSRTVSEVPETQFGIRWSPDGSEIAVLRYRPADQRRELVVHPAAGPVGPVFGPEGLWYDAPEWDRTGRRIAYQTVTSLALRSWDLDTGEVTDLTTGEAVAPRFSRSGRYFSYSKGIAPSSGDIWQNVVVVRDRTTGIEQEVPTPPSRSGASAPVIQSWQESEFLALATVAQMVAPRQTELVLVPAFDGAFRVAGVPLDPGVNVVEAEAIETQTGSISDPSEPVTITTPLDAYADLVASSADLASYPALPMAGQQVALSARIRNVGMAAASDVSVRLVLRNGSGTLLDQTVTLSAVPAGGSAVASAYWTATAPGTYLLRAEADAYQAIPESSEANNAAESGLHVAAVAELMVSASTDRSSYPAHAPVRVRVEVANGGVPWSGTVRTEVTTAAGATVAEVDARPLSIEYGQSVAFDLPWNTGVTLAGDYAVRVRAYTGEVLTATAESPFRIEPETAVWARVTPADPTAPLGSSAQFAARIENRGANSPLAGASARLRVVGADGSTPFEATVPVPALAPGGAWEGSFTWSPAAPAGVHAVRLDAVATNGVVLATAQSAIEVQTVVGLQGTLTLAPVHTLAGGPVAATATVTNVGSASLPAQQFAVEVRNGAMVLVTVPFTLDLPAGAARTATVSIPTAGLPFGIHPVFLRAAGMSASLHASTLHVHAPIVAPSIDAPPNGGVVTSQRPMLSVNNAATPSGAALSYSFEVYRDQALSMPVPGASAVPETPERTSWTVQSPLEEDARYWWRARATDGFSSSPWTAVVSFVVHRQNTPPGTPRIESPRDGDVVALLQPELAVVNAFDPDPELLTYEFRVARDAAMSDVVASASGVPETSFFTRWIVPTPLTEDGTYFWTARAHDAQLPSPWTVPVRFRVDTTNLPPSAVPLLRPADEAEIAALSTELAVGPAVDPEGDPLTYRFEIDRVPTFDSADKQISPEIQPVGVEATWTPPLPLPDNAHAYWRAAARDPHSSGPWATRRFFVNLANDAPGVPVPLDPAAGSVVTTATPALRVRNAVDPDLDLLTYEFEIYIDGGGLVAAATGVPQGPSDSVWIVAEPLVENGAFTWRARAHDGTTAGEWTVPVPFRVNAVADPPSAPMLVSPREGTVLTGPPEALVVSNAVSPDGQTLAYDFELYVLGAGGELVLVEAATGIASGLVETSWSPSASIVDGSYSWRARAVDPVQPGPWMASAHFTVASDQPPAAPVGLTALAGNASVALSWQPNLEPDLTGYRVYRATTPGGPYAFVAATAQTSMTDGGLTNGQTVFYVVTATDATQEGPRSAEASATPQTGPVIVQVASWPGVIEGECLHCPGTPPPETPHIGPLQPVLRCVLAEAGAGTTTAFFGFDNATSSGVGLPVGPDNFFSPGLPDRSQPTAFSRGEPTDFPGVFGVPFTSPITWTLAGLTATAEAGSAVDVCPLPPIQCRRWFYVTLEPPIGHDPMAIDVGSLRLGGALGPDATYRAVVDRDGDGLLELEVRFEQAGVWPLVGRGRNLVRVTGTIGPLEIVGTTTTLVDRPQARADFTPAELSANSRHPRVELALRGCFAHTAIDVPSIRLNGAVPVRQLISSTPERTIVEFDLAAVRALLPVGNRVEVVVSGLANGQPFYAVDYIKVLP